MSEHFEEVFANGRSLTLNAGQHLFRVGDAVEAVHLVLSGQVQLRRVTQGGAMLTLQKAVGGDVLAEASVYASQYHCDGVVSQPAVVKRLPLAVFRQALIEDRALAERWAQRLADATQAARMRAEFRSLKTVSSRLDAWLSMQGALPTKGQWQNIATELGVSREALYRELARRR